MKKTKKAIRAKIAEWRNYKKLSAQSANENIALLRKELDGEITSADDSGGGGTTNPPTPPPPPPKND